MKMHLVHKYRNENLYTLFYMLILQVLIFFNRFFKCILSIQIVDIEFRIFDGKFRRTRLQKFSCNTDRTELLSIDI